MRVTNLHSSDSAWLASVPTTSQPDLLSSPAHSSYSTSIPTIRLSPLMSIAKPSTSPHLNSSVFPISNTTERSPAQIPLNVPQLKYHWTFPRSNTTERISLPQPEPGFEDGPLYQAKLAGLKTRTSNLSEGLKLLIKLVKDSQGTLLVSIKCEKKLDKGLVQVSTWFPPLLLASLVSLSNHRQHLWLLFLSLTTSVK